MKLRGTYATFTWMLLAMGASTGCNTEGEATDPASAAAQDLNLVGKWPSGDIKVCFDPPVANDATLATWRAQVADIVQQEWGNAAGLTFSGWGACDTATFGTGWIWITSNVNTTTGALEGGSWGTVGYRTGGDVIAFGGNRDNPLVILHEFGHCLGFTHEIQRQDNFSAPDPNCTAPKPATPYDNDLSVSPGNTFDIGYYSNGIMNVGYCGPTVVDTFAELDTVSAQAAYGIPDQLKTVNFIDPNGVPYSKLIGRYYYSFGSELPNGRAKLVTQNSDRHILAIGSDDKVYVRWKAIGGSWSQFSPFGGGLPGETAEICHTEHSAPRPCHRKRRQGVREVVRCRPGLARFLPIRQRPAERESQGNHSQDQRSHPGDWD